LNCSCGIDWAEGHYDVAIINGDGKLVAKKRISDDPAGFSELTEMLAAACDGPEDLIPIAIETPRGLLVAALRATGPRLAGRAPAACPGGVSAAMPGARLVGHHARGGSSGT